MKRETIVLLVVVVLASAGAAGAAVLSGEVTAVDTTKGTLTMKSETINAVFDCETGSLLKDVKAGDKVTVEYKEQGGKKIVTKITPMKKASGGY